MEKEQEVLQEADNGKQMPKWLQKYGYLLIFAAVSVLISLFAFKSSFLYPLNDWVDPNCFMTMGRGILKGKVMYRDLYEQKGPYVYFLHAIAALISDTSFLGMWFLEIINLFFCMVLIAKIVGLYGHKRSVCVVCALLIGFSSCFSYAMVSGDSVEEFASPMFLWLLYVTVKNIKQEKKFTLLQYTLIGFTAGIVFWSKFTLVGIYIGWFIYYAWRRFRCKEYKEIVKAIFFIVCGVVLATLPCFIYFLVNGAIKDWLTSYIYNNLFIYSKGGNIFKTILEFLKAIGLTLIWNPQYTLPAIFGIAWFVKKKEGEERWFLVWIASVALVFFYIGGRGYRYYGLPLYVFAVFGYVSVLELIAKKNPFVWLKRCAWLATAAVLISSLCFFFINGHSDDIFRAKEDTVQHKFARYIRENGDENPTVLNYGMLDSGFYLATGQVPEFKHFNRLNIPLEEMFTEMDRYLDEGLADYVVDCVAEKRKEPISHENYREVMRVYEDVCGDTILYILYEKI
ncbi:MAG: hypothetical protein E7352_05305 [Clostridiales bacterium]|nr:hypothetical protein [Clostridiales bacterium]